MTKHPYFTILATLVGIAYAAFLALVISIRIFAVILAYRERRARKRVAHSPGDAVRSDWKQS